MAFDRRLLTGGERVVVELRPHWSALGWPIPAVAVAVAATIAALVVWPSAPVGVGEALLGLVALSALWLGGRLLRWSRTWLVITTTRLVQRSGVLRRRGFEIRLVRVNEISYEQSLLGHLVGTGRLCIEVGGERGLVCFDHVRKPAAVAGVLHEQIDAVADDASDPKRRALEDGGDGRDAGPRPRWRQRDWGEDDTPPTGTPLAGSEAGSLSRRLVELDDLRRRGLLTEDEFAEQKARLLRDR
jgi:hypothetical protein